MYNFQIHFGLTILKKYKIEKDNRVIVTYSFSSLVYYLYYIQDESTVP